MPRSARARAVVLAVLLTLVGSGCRGATTAGGGGTAPLTSRSAASPGDGGGGTPTTVASPQVPATGGTATGGTATGGTAATDNMVTLDGTARSVETTALVTGLSSVHLSGSSVLTATGDVIDRNGRDLGTGSLRATGTNLTVTGTGAGAGAAGSVQLAGRVRVQPGLVTVDDGPSGSIGLAFSPSATIVAGSLTFQPPPPPQPPGPVGPAATAPPAGSPATVAPTTTLPPPVAVAGPVTLRANGLQIAGAALTLVGAPATLSVAAGEADLSWAGSGTITTARGALRATYLGVRAQQLQATLHRSGAEVDVHGTGSALQAYANGVPQLQISARIDVLSTGATTGFLGHRHAFVWTPRNLDAHYDMAILSIHPGNAAARGVHLGLLPMPAMFGGEPHALVGGDTTGLKSGDAIDSLIARQGNDKRSIGYDAAPGVPLVLVVQGNFAPITVTVTTY